jgi:hypothetical protein
MKGTSRISITKEREINIENLNKIKESEVTTIYTRNKNKSVDNLINKIKQFKNNLLGNTTLSKKSNLLTNIKFEKLYAEDFIGKTLNPDVAFEFKHAFKINHLGTVISTRNKAKELNSNELKILNASIIVDLNKTNSSGTRDTARTNREVVLDLISTLNSEINKIDKKEIDTIESLKKINDNLKSLWLSSEIGNNSINNKLESISKELLALELPNSSQKAQKLAIEASKTKLFTQKHDNTFGRKFESEFVFSLVQNPPKSILNAADKVGDYLKNYLLSSYNEPDLSIKLTELANALDSDPRPWHTETPEIQNFIKDPSKENFEKLMSNQNRTGYEVIKQSFVGVKLSLIIQGKWMPAANSNYQQLIKKARSTTPSVLGNFIKRTPVISIEFQKKINANPEFRKKASNEFNLVKNLLNLIDSNPTNENALVNFRFINNIIKNDFPDLSSAAEEIISSLKNETTDSFLELTSEELSPEEKENLSSEGIYPTIPKTEGFGTRLPHHLPNKGGENWGVGKNIQASVHVNVDTPTIFEKNTLDSDQNTVNGASGSTNIMTFLYRQMLRDSPKSDKENQINIHDAFAGTMMFLTFDGGHSLPESFGTFNSIFLNDPQLNGTTTPTIDKKQLIEQREKLLQEFNLEYHEIPKMFNSKDTAKATQDAIDSAFAETTKLFSEVHSQRIIDE